MYSFLHHPNLSKTDIFVLLVILLTLLSCYKLNRCYIKLSLVNILEHVFVFIEILFKMLLFKGGVLIYAEHCIYIYIRFLCKINQKQQMINSVITRVTGKITEWIKNIYLIGYDGLRMTMNVGGRKK